MTITFHILWFMVSMEANMWTVICTMSSTCQYIYIIYKCLQENLTFNSGIRTRFYWHTHNMGITSVRKIWMVPKQLDIALPNTLHSLFGTWTLIFLTESDAIIITIPFCWSFSSISARMHGGREREKESLFDCNFQMRKENYNCSIKTICNLWVHRYIRINQI